jgi:hypothetical protein
MIIPSTILASWSIAGTMAAFAAVFLVVKIAVEHAKGDRTAMRQARRLRARLSSFKDHARTLDEHSHEYAAVFSGNEWQQLTEMLQQLDALDSEIHTLLARKKYNEARNLLGQVYSQERDVVASELESLIDWEQSVHAMLKNVVHNLEVATTQTRQITDQPASSGKSRKRQPTVMTLADIKKSLIESGELY